jgi:hypothetical protein
MYSEEKMYLFLSYTPSKHRELFEWKDSKKKPFSFKKSWILCEY